MVLVADENDNPPRLARRRWELEVEETPPSVHPPPNTTLLELTASDEDTESSLLFRVSVGSGMAERGSGSKRVCVCVC